MIEPLDQPFLPVDYPPEEAVRLLAQNMQRIVEKLNEIIEELNP